MKSQGKDLALLLRLDVEQGSPTEDPKLFCTKVSDSGCWTEDTSTLAGADRFVVSLVMLTLQLQVEDPSDLSSSELTGRKST